MIEPEIAFSDLADDADLAEEFLKCIFTALLAERADDMKFFAERIDKDCIARARDVRRVASFARMTYTEAIAALREDRQDVRVPGARGASICRPSTSAT